MTIYIDITQLEKGRANTGIQRVVKEFLKRASICTNITYKIIILDEKNKKAQILDNTEVSSFLNDVQNYQFISKTDLDLINLKPTTTTAFFDIDSNWNVIFKRGSLYPILKNNGFLIFNFIYDMIPIVLPQYTHKDTAINFRSFIDAIYKHSDLVMFDSLSAQNDFENIKNEQNITRDISTRVIGLGSDFLKTDIKPQDENIINILNKKYILFVGTLEPRKNQADVLEAFESIAEKYPNLNLVIIGKRGWDVEVLIQKILTHPLKNKQLFWLDNIDDNTLSQFYQNAFLVTYLSKYEGYGLPIAESLSYGNITITSKNSSMYEVGKDAADYVVYNSLNELTSIISLYCDNENLYKAKKQYIKNNFKTTSWEQFYTSISDIFCNFEKSLQLKQNHLSILQFVFISIDKHNLEGTIKAIDKYMNFVKEYIIVTHPKFIKEFQQIKSTNKLIIIDENEILAEYKKDFTKKNHQSKNWLLRASLLNLDILEDEFIMLDDDNRPLKNITIDKFISKDGSYNAYFFYPLLDWHHLTTDYDLGQKNIKNTLYEKNYELLSYSSHSPQIINKKIFKEAIDKFFDIGLKIPIDEWSAYFNYAVSLYPYSFNKKVYETLSWPATPTDWEFKYIPTEISFENYYKELYDIEFFQKTDTHEQKVQKNKKQLVPYIKSKKTFEKNIDILSKNNMVHTTLKFKTDDVELFLSNVPYFVVVEQNSDIKLKLNYKLLNPSEKNLDISLVVFLDGNYRTLRHLSEIDSSSYQEATIEMPIISKNLEEDIYDISFNLMINNRYLYKKLSPFFMKLIVTKNKDASEILGNPQLLEPTYKNNSKQKIKNKIKTIPFIGWLSRWSYNLLRLNNLKHISYSNTKNIQALSKQLNQQQVYQQTQTNQQHQQINQQQQQIKQQQIQIQSLLKENNKHNENYIKIIDTIKLNVNKQVCLQSILFHQKIDNFIEESKQPNSKPKELQALKENISSFVMDDYYLAFEETFRGSQELILERYKEYLKYLNPDIKTALDIGCGRGEWTGLLQKNSIDAYGIDLNFAMLNVGKNQGIKNLQKIDAFDFFQSCPDNSYDLVTAFHIIEHIPFEKLFVFLQEIKRVASPNATILLETPSPANPLVANFEFYKDPTHLNPLPSDVIKFMVEYIGFKNVDVDFLHPHPTNEIAQDYLIIAKNSKLEQLSLKKNDSKKLKLAYISPFPPLRTGIADYSCELVPYLESYYDIEIINNESSSESFPTRTDEWFESNYEYYDRVLYHFGNSSFHSYMLPLLKKIPGVVVLHDFYLGDLMEVSHILDKNFLYYLHGYSSLCYLKSTNINKVLSKFPCNKEILNRSKSIIVHSQYSKTLTSHWYSDISLDNYSTIPLLRESAKIEKKPLSKKILKLPDNSFVVCTFGLIAKNKQNQELLQAWINSSLSKESSCYLIFVGQNDKSDYAKELTKTINNNDNIYITGWIDSQTFKDYLNLADMAVQLRSFSRGETSAALLDCMNYALPTITNANGSIAELPSDTLYMLEDKFKVEELTLALETLYFDTKKRETLSKKAKAYITKMHNPQACASMYKDVIERAYSPSKEPQINLDVETLSLTTLDKAKQKQILVDISSIVKDDLKTGIQRVVRSQLIELIKNSPDNIRIEPIYLSNSHYCYARSYTTKLLNLQTLELPDEPINVNSGDIFYGLDLNAKEISKSIELGIYERYKSIGVKFYFVVYDLLPILNPEFFPKSSKQIHTQWLKNITQVADKLICISNVVEAEVKAFSDVEVTSLHLGANIAKEVTNITRTIKEKTTFLMVGTIEPRKGHSQVLEAFEELWMEGVDVNLIIVGKKGWMVEEFIEKFTSHPELNNRLTYLEAISDEELCNIYISSDCLIAASQAEGFGLPLIEAAQYNLPIIARDISVFREVASTNAYYFKDTKDSKELALSIKNWLKLYKENSHPLSSKMQYLSWKENAQKLFEIF